MPFHTKSGIKIDHHDQFITPSFLNANNIENINKEVYTTNFDMLKSWKKERKFISALPYWFLGMMTASLDQDLDLDFVLIHDFFTKNWKVS